MLGETLLVSRASLTVAALVASFMLPAGLMATAIALVLCVFLVVRGWQATLGLVISVLAMAVPLAAVHGVINPAFPVTDHAGPVPWRAAGAEFAWETAEQLTLFFAAAAIWRGVPTITLAALISRARLPAAVCLTLLYAAVLVEVLKRRISSIQLAMRSRGVLDGESLSGRGYALIAMTVPLIAATLLEAVARSEARAQLGEVDPRRLAGMTVLRRPSIGDFVLALTLLTSCVALLLYGR